MTNASRTSFAYAWAVGIALASFTTGGCDGGDVDQLAAPAPDQVESISQAAFGTGSTDPGVYYQLKNVSSGLCADVSGNSQLNGGAVIQFGCSSGHNQHWYFRALGSPTYQLSVQHSAKCLRVTGGSTTSGAAMVQDACVRPTGSGSAGSVFTAKQINTGQYQLIADTGKCLEAPDNTSKTPLVQATCSTATKFLWAFNKVATVAGSDTAGRMGAVISMKNVVPISGAVLSNGKVLMWASWSGLEFGGGSSSLDQTVTLLLDPANLSNPVVKTVTNTAHNMFCPGTAMLADGRVLVSGGDDTRTTATSIYNPATDSWTKGPVMNQQRWYNSSVTLPDGRALTMGGNRTSGESGNAEIYNPANNTWTLMDGLPLAPITAGATADNRAMEHARMFVAPDGRLFVPGPTPNMQWYSLSGSGSVTSAGRRGSDEFSQNDVTVMFDQGKILKAGGNISYDRTNATTTTSSQNSYIIDITTSTANVTPIGPMLFPRAYANGVVLPNGKVFVAGGLDNGKGFSDDGNIKPTEMFDPATNTWTETPPLSNPRPYHSIVLLLPDGRVLIGGGGLCSGNPSCSVNHPDIEVYSPPYLFAGARPAISSAPGTVTANGGAFDVTVTGTVTGFSLIRMASVTHTVDTDQRFMHVTASGSGGTWSLTAPANHNVAPPGYYMLFAMNGEVPSPAKIVKIN